LTWWLPDVIGHVTTLFAIFDSLTALCWTWHELEIRSYKHLGAVSINGQKFTGSRDPDHASVLILLRGHVGIVLESMRVKFEVRRFSI